LILLKPVKLFSPFLRKDFQAVIILGLVLLAVYFPLVFLNYSYNPSYDSLTYPSLRIAGSYVCFTDDCLRHYFHTIDPWANGIGYYPLIKTAVNMYSDGIVPLWNPYLLTGYPMFAELTNLNFSPMLIFYFLPEAYWDIPLILALWFVGIFTYFLLRIWKLSHISSLIGSIIFMLSGPFTWYLTHGNIPVIIFMPLILFSIEKVFQKDFRYMIIGSLALAASILGTHLESIVLVFLITMIYVIFRVVSRHNFDDQDYSDIKQTNGLALKKQRKIPFFYLIAIFLGGIGLTSFFLLPSAEFVLEQAALFREGTNVGATGNVPSYTLSSLFVPYILGTPHQYLNTPATGLPWVFLVGYVVVSSLIFSIIGISRKTKNKSHKLLAQFFLALSTFFILKSIGFPIITEIGNLPILEHIVFPRYSIFIITFGFAISASIGIESLMNNPLKTKKLIVTALISSAIILFLILLLLPQFNPTSQFSEYYFVIQIVIALFFILSAFLLVLFIQRNKLPINQLLFLIFLEASLYIPMGLSPEWQFYRSLVVITGVIMILSVSGVGFRTFNVENRNTKLLILFIIITIGTIAGQQIIYLESPTKLPIREEFFQENDVTNFLKTNSKNYRIVSFNGAFGPNFPSAYEIEAVGGLSSINLKTTDGLKKTLDPHATAMSFNFEVQRGSNPPPFDYVYSQNQRLFDFLGVKYIISFDADPRFPKIVTGREKVTNLNSDTEKIKQNLVFNTNSISSLAIWMGNYGKINTGEVILEIDSIPFDSSLHRISKIDAEKIGGMTIFEFEKIDNVLGKEFQLKLYHTEARPGNFVAISVSKPEQIIPGNYDIIQQELYLDDQPTGNFIPVVEVLENFSLILDEHVKIYENNNAFPRVFLVNKYRVTDSFENAQKIIQNPDFDLRNEVVLEKNLATHQTDLLNSSILDDSISQIIRYSPNEIVIKTQSDHASLLVLTDSYYPGWFAYIDGEETEIFRTNGIVRSVFVPPGNHSITFSFMPQFFLFGLMISIITIVILFSIYFLKVFLKQKPKRIQ